MKRQFIALPIIALLFLVTSPLQAAAAPYAENLALPDYAFIDSFVGHGQTYPLSCESRSAADVAAFWGLSVSEVTFFNNLPVSDNPDVGFVGSVYGSWGQIPPNPYGVHAKPVAKLLRQYGLDAQAQSGMSLNDLKAEIAAGRPVIVWVIGRVWSGTPTQYSANDGSTVTVAKYEHTMVAYGYDQNNIYLVDAGSGNRAGYPTNTFKTSWAVLGNMAVTAVGADQPTTPPSNPEKGETYVVQKGDYLTKLASMWGISWQDLAALNGITYPYTIYPGQVLYTGRSSGETNPTPTATAKPTQQTTPQPTKTQAPPATKTPEPTSGDTFSYTVQSGDYLVKVAEKFNLDWKVIAALNKLSWPYTIYPGQKLTLPGQAPTATAKPTQAATATPAPTQQPTSQPTKTATPTPTQEVETYTVQRGEHLMQIARKLELSWTAIAQMNNLTSPYTLYPGQVLQLPGPDAGPPPPPLVEEEEEGQTPSSGETYTVKSGDYIYALAQKFGVNWQTLAANNNISYPYIIYTGQVLKIP